MKTLFTYRVNRTCAYFAMWCFVLGNLLFLSFLATESDVLMGTGIVFMAVMMVITPVALVILGVNTLLNLKDIRQHLIAIFMVLVNIPVSIYYIKLVSTF